MAERSLATRLRVLRAERRLTLRDVEEKTGVAKETISDIERGVRHPQDRTLAKLAEGYGVPVEELLEEPVLAGKAEAPPQSEISGEERQVDLDKLREMLTTAGAKTHHLSLPDEEFEVLWEGKTAEQRAQINQELIEERNLVKPLLVRWASMPVSKERSQLHDIWRHIYLVRLMTIAVEKNQAAAEAEAEAARQSGDEERAEEVLKAAEEFAKKAA